MALSVPVGLGSDAGASDRYRSAHRVRTARGGEQGHSTSTIAERVDAGESVTDIAADYDLAGSDIGQAVVYERAA
jgi:hypothetical protein